MKIVLSNASGQPLYQQIKDQLKDAILKEELTEGAPLPSIRSFANELKVSVLTIRRVYDELEKEGFVTSQIGVGTFVSAGNVELLRESKRRLVEEKMQEMITLAKTLSISKEELIAMMDILYEEGVNMETVLQVTELCKTFGGFSLDNVSFSILEGCITGFIGANGAGKTTTLRAILGLTQRDSGSVQIFGMDAAAHAQEVKDRIGVVLDHGCFYEELTLQEMKSVVAPAYSTWREEDFRYYMERFALQPKQRIQTLSTGMKMKFALALALSHQAELLIMDEPTSGLDPLVRRQFLDLLREYMEKGGRGVLFSTHITSDLDKVADMLVMIDHGKILFQEEKDALLEKHCIVKGDRAVLTDAVRQKFMTLEETAFGFSGLTSHAEELMAAFPDLVVERPTIEDIMLGHIKGGVV